MAATENKSVNRPRMTPAEKRLWNALRRGKGNEIPQENLAKHFGVERRTIRIHENGLRKKGYPVGSNDNGIFICASPEELEEFLRTRYAAQWKDMRACSEALQASDFWNGG